MSGTRTGASRAEIVVTVVVVALVALAVVALWPGGGPGASRNAPAVTAGEPDNDPGSSDPAALAAARSAAALPPCPSPSGRTASGPLAGVRLPCLGADGGPGGTDVGAALAGRPALVNVWASWCAPCRAELPALATYAERAGAVPVLTVDVRDDPLAALGMLRELGVRLPAVTDPDGALRAALDVPPTLPASFVVRADGSVSRVDPPTPFRSADEVATTVDRLT